MAWKISPSPVRSRRFAGQTFKKRRSKEHPLILYVMETSSMMASRGGIMRGQCTSTSGTSSWDMTHRKMVTTCGLWNFQGLFVASKSEGPWGPGRGEMAWRAAGVRSGVLALKKRGLMWWTSMSLMIASNCLESSWRTDK